MQFVSCKLVAKSLVFSLINLRDIVYFSWFKGILIEGPGNHLPDLDVFIP